MDAQQLHLGDAAMAHCQSIARGPDPRAHPQLKAALTTLASECLSAAPPDVFKVFPDFKNELTECLLSSTAEKLQVAMASLSDDAAAVDDPLAHNYALHAFRAALDVHATYSRAGAAAAAAATFCQDFGTFSPPAPPTQVDELLQNPPAEVRAAFPEFDLELRQMLGRPVDELKATVARLEQALANLVEARCFDDGAIQPSAPQVEALAIDFSLRAMSAAIVEAEALSDVSGMRKLALSTEMPAEIGTPRVPPPPSDPALPLESPALPHQLGEIGALLPMALDELDKFKLEPPTPRRRSRSGGSGAPPPPPPAVHHALWAQAAHALQCAGATADTGGSGSTVRSSFTGGTGGTGGAGETAPAGAADMEVGDADASCAKGDWSLPPLMAAGHQPDEVGPLKPHYPHSFAGNFLGDASGRLSGLRISEIMDEAW